jgi:hypothetical protein
MADEFPDSGPAYGTANETAFIQSIGSFSVIGLNCSKRKLLQGFLTGCALRDRWSGLDRKRVIAFAESELKKMEEEEQEP